MEEEKEQDVGEHQKAIHKLRHHNQIRHLFLPLPSSDIDPLRRDFFVIIFIDEIPSRRQDRLGWQTEHFRHERISNHRLNEDRQSYRFATLVDQVQVRVHQEDEKSDQSHVDTDAFHCHKNMEKNVKSRGKNVKSRGKNVKSRGKNIISLS